MKSIFSENEEVYAVGDLQGCRESLDELLELIPESAKLIFVGDIVNRGPDSLGTLRAVKALCEKDRAMTLLGNHDLHLLAVAAGAGSAHRKDTISDILSAPDRDALIDWLRAQPLLITMPGYVFVHAGIAPQCDLKTAKKLAKEVHDQLAGPQWKDYLAGMYGNDLFKPKAKGVHRMRAILNGFTRMRYVDADGRLEFESKGGIGTAPQGLMPWFDYPRKVKRTICFGHWSTLGLLLRPDTIAIDTGCLWGGALTAIRLSDRKIIEVRCPQWAAPGC